MAFQRGDVVLIPFPFTDLSARKTRPAIVVSSELYNTTRSDLLLAYASSQIIRAHDELDYVLTGWKAAGLPKPSFVRPKIAAIESSMIVHKVGQLSKVDLDEVDQRLRLALDLAERSVSSQ